MKLSPAAQRAGEGDICYAAWLLWAPFGKSEISHIKEHLEIHLIVTNLCKYPLEMHIN